MSKLYMPKIVPEPEIFGLEKRTKRLVELSKERPRTLVAVRYGYNGETFVSVGFTNLETVGPDTITLDNGINEIPLHMHGNNFLQVYVNKNLFLDYCPLDKKEESKPTQSKPKR